MIMFIYYYKHHTNQQADQQYMPMYGSHLQYHTADFFNNLDENLELSYDKNNICDIQKAISKIESIQIFIEEILVEIEYCGEFASHYDNFASKYGETDILKESNYMTFDLDEYTVDTLSGNHTRTWIYNSELSLIKDKLCKKKLNIETHITTFDVRAAIALALLKQ